MPFATVLPPWINRAVIASYLASVLPPPWLNIQVGLKVNGRVLKSRLHDIGNGFFLQVSLPDSHELCRDLRTIPQRVFDLLHVFPPVTIYSCGMEYFCHIPGGLTLQHCRLFTFQDDERFWEEQLRIHLCSHFKDLRTNSTDDAKVAFVTVHSSVKELICTEER